MVRFGLLIAGFLAFAATGVGASPDPKTLEIPPADLSKARDLVAKLGSTDFEEREAAYQDLAGMTRFALPALTDGLTTHPSPEVRFRCQSLLPRAATADLEARLATFLADTKGKYSHDLPGWNEFHLVAGNSPTARTVFAELLDDSTNRALTLASAEPGGDLPDLVAARKQEIYNWRYPRTANSISRNPTFDDVLALMFAESRVPGKYNPRTLQSSVLYNTPGFSAAVTDPSDKGKVFKSVVARWIETRDEPVAMYQAITLATSLDLPNHAASLGVRLLHTKTATWLYRLNGAMKVAQLDAKQYLPALEKAFTDETAVPFRRAVAGRIEAVPMQIRDIALAAALLLTAQEPTEYGFIDVNRYGGANRFTYSNWLLPEEERKGAFDKWAAWREKNKDFGKPADELKKK